MQDKGSDMKERILVALYEEGKNTSGREVLIRIGEVCVSLVPACVGILALP
jgi:hypothetical protein